jgi:hypothetical protein
LKDLPEPLSSTALTALEPMSKPTTARDLPNTLDLAWPPHALHSVAPVGRVGRHRAPDHPRGPSLRTSRSGFRLTDDPMSKGGAKARHSVRNWRFCVPAHRTHASNRDPLVRSNITKLLGKLPRNVSDHENLQCFQGEIVLHGGAQGGATPGSGGVGRRTGRVRVVARSFLTPPAGKPTHAPSPKGRRVSTTVVTTARGGTRGNGRPPDSPDASRQRQAPNDQLPRNAQRPIPKSTTNSTRSRGPAGTLGYPRRHTDELSPRQC